LHLPAALQSMRHEDSLDHSKVQCAYTTGQTDTEHCTHQRMCGGDRQACIGCKHNHRGGEAATWGLSLMKDSNYTYSIINNLIQMNHRYLKSEEWDKTEAEHMIALNRKEIKPVMDGSENNPRQG